MDIGWPELIWIGLNLFGLGYSTTKGGREFLSTTAATAIQVGLLWWGGFFS